MPLTLEEARALFEEEDEERRTGPMGVSLEEARSLFGLPPEEPPSRVSQATEAIRAAVSPEPFPRPAEVSPQALGLEIPSPAATSRTIPPALPPEPAVAPPPPPLAERVVAGERPPAPVSQTPWDQLAPEQKKLRADRAMKNLFGPQATWATLTPEQKNRVLQELR